MAWNLHAIDQTQLWGRRRVDGVEAPRHRADATKETRHTTQVLRRPVPRGGVQPETHRQELRLAARPVVERAREPVHRGGIGSYT